MGLRGPGSGARRDSAAKATKSKMAWERPGLSRVARNIAFIEELPVTKGLLQGSKMKLLPDQIEFLEDLYGDRRPKPVRIAIKSEPRGNGKTGLVAGICLSHLLGPESEIRGEVYSAAIDREQAGLLYREMEAIVLAVPNLAVRVNPTRFTKQMEVLEGHGKGSIYAALSADARRAHGLAPSLWVYDELAQAKNRELLDNLQTAMGKRKRSLGIVISTQAPNDDHALSVMIDDAMSGADPTVICHLLAVPEDEDPYNMEVLRKYNPALGLFLNEEDVRAAAEKARRIPSEQPAFLNLRANRRVDSSGEQRLVPAATWRKCSEPPVMAVPRGRQRRLFLGLDLSATEDLTALVAALEDPKDNSFDLQCTFWTPQGSLESRSTGERELFRNWINEGHLTAVPGNVIQYSFVAKQIGLWREKFPDLVLGYDRWGIKFLQPSLAQEGLDDIKMEPFGQGYQDMSPAIGFAIELLLTGRIRHGGHPVLTTCVANGVITTDPAGNRKVDKGKSNARATTRIDGEVAMLIALGTARRYVADNTSINMSDFLKNAVAA